MKRLYLSLLSTLILFSGCVTTQISTRIASVHTKQDLLSEFGYPQDFKDLGKEGKIWEYYNNRGELYARYWVDNNGKIYYRTTYGVPERTLPAVGWVLVLVGSFAVGWFIGI